VTTTEKIIVSGDNFIERQITICLQQDDIRHMQVSAYGRGYKHGWMIGFLVALAVVSVSTFCIWLAVQY
jgi:ABC-type amino acid transport system permease subunit